MTPKRKWPDNCEEVRMNVISKTRHAKRLLKESAYKTDNPDLLRDLQQVTEILTDSEIMLREVGSVSPEYQEKNHVANSD